jgi:RNA polymerase sigma factor for flagellar operon FliA
MSSRQVKLTNEQIKLIEDNLELVDIYAKKLRKVKVFKMLEYDDLIQEGFIGLCDAAKKWDNRPDVKFTTYASHRIEGAIYDAARVARPFTRSELNHAIAGDDLSEFKQYETATERVYQLWSAKRMISLNSLIKKQKMQDVTVEDTLLDELSLDEHTRDLIRIDTENEIMTAIQTLKERERLILYMYYWEEMSGTEIGNYFGITECRISQIRKKSEIKLSRILNRYNLLVA